MLNNQNFSLALPEVNSLPPKKSEQAEIVLQSVEETPQKLLVLIFSRDLDFRFMFKTYLKMLDFEVAEAENEIEMIEASIKRPDLILMDVYFPFADSMTAMSDLQKYETLEKVPFVLLSGFAQKGYRSAAFAAGAAEYLIKPIDFDLLECSLELLLSDIRKKQQGGAS
jgi:two-component system, NtrC family, response regulator HydG